MCLRYPEAEKWSPPVIYYTTCYPHHKYICLRTILILSPLFLSNGPWITKNCFPFLFQAIFYLKANIISLQSFQELKYVLFFLFDQILENIKPLSTLSDEPSPTCPYPTLRTMLKLDIILQILLMQEELLMFASNKSCTHMLSNYIWLFSDHHDTDAIYIYDHFRFFFASCF